MRIVRLPYYVLIGAVFATGSAFACQVPVFRYALERWIPDAYRLESAEALPHTESANITHSRSGGDTLTLHYPKTTGIAAPFWSAPANPNNLASIPDSPLRREILRRILSGDSAVWLLVESGDEEKDDAAFDTLTSALRQAESDLELPEGIIGTEEARLRDVSPEEEENVLVSSIPLQIKFSALRISRQDPAESVFLSLLLHMEDDLGDYADEPIAFTVFGRGRVLPPLVAGGISASNILGDCTYLCGACSCQVKRENPGIDALFTADWDSALGAGTVVIDKILPPLSGPGDLVAPHSDAAADPPPNPTIPPESASSGTATETFSFLAIIAMAVGLVALLALSTVRILSKKT